MTDHSSRRDFLTAGLALPAAGLNGGAERRIAPFSAAAAGVPLKFRKLGNTGIKVTEMGFGCMITSDPSVIEKAADMGINYFDTARVYGGGNNERMVGAALKSRRKNIFLSTKTKAMTKEQALADIDTSLKELQTDYVDIWYLHDRKNAGQITDDVMEAQRIAKQAGKIRFAGVSNHTAHAEIIPAVIKAKHFDVLLTSYNFALDRIAEPHIAQAREAGIGIVAMKVMAGGFRKAPYYPSDDQTRQRLSTEGAMLAALKWVLKDKNVDVAIPSIIDMDQFDEDVQAMASPFSTADEKALRAQLELIRPLYCRTCGTCSGMCPKGVPVADVLRCLMYAEGYGQFPLARERFNELPVEARDVRCSDCSQCSIQCPNGVHVAERLIRAQELFA